MEFTTREDIWEKEKEKWNGDFRKPPKPKHYYTKTKGNCRCGNVILNDKEDTINTRKKAARRLSQLNTY